MSLPFDIAQLDAAIVQLLFESLTERESIPALGFYPAATLRDHLIALVENGYVLGDVLSSLEHGKTARARCLTIKGYTLLSALNLERRNHPAMPSPVASHSAAPQRYTGRWAYGS